MKLKLKLKLKFVVVVWQLFVFGWLLLCCWKELYRLFLYTCITWRNRQKKATVREDSRLFHFRPMSAGQAGKIKKVLTTAEMAKRYAAGELAPKIA